MIHRANKTLQRYFIAMGATLGLDFLIMVVFIRFGGSLWQILGVTALFVAALYLQGWNLVRFIIPAHTQVVAEACKVGNRED